MNLNSTSRHQFQKQNAETMITHKQNEEDFLRTEVLQLQKEILEKIGYGENYRIHNIPIADSYSFEEECIHTVQITSKAKTDKYVYLGHGFGGSSLMYLVGLELLLEKANVILWEIRGMGLNWKPPRYEITGQSQIINFFVNGLKIVIDFYCHKDICLVSHSFSSYLTLRYVLEHQKNNKINKLILLSPVGITPKQEDYKYVIRSCGDIKHIITSKLGWKFNLTYKSPMRTICSCIKERLLKGAFETYGLGEQFLNLLVRLFLMMVKLKDGSQNLFFDCFEPRVLPKPNESIVEILNNDPTKTLTGIPIKMVFGETDWADQTGCKNLSNQHSNISIQIMDKCDHMLPVYEVVMQKIVESWL